MAIRDVVNALQAAFAQLVPPGNSAVTPSQGATGSVALSGTAFGSFRGLLQVLTSGVVGAATAQLSLDNGQNFGTPFTVQATLGITLDPSPIQSGLTLSFSGTFTSGDSYVFTANGTTSFSLGEEFIPYQDIFPRIVFVPTESDFDGPKDFSGTQNQDNSVRSLLTDVFTLEAHCWGIDLDRTELLRDQLINCIKACVGGGGAQYRTGRWTRNNYEVSKAGRVFILPFQIQKPVLEVAQTWIIAPPPFTEIDSQELDPYQGR